MDDAYSATCLPFREIVLASTTNTIAFASGTKGLNCPRRRA